MMREEQVDNDILKIAEKCSKHQELEVSELPTLRPYVESFLDRDWLNTKLTEYKTWAKNNSYPFLQHNFLHRPIGCNMLVSAIWATDYWENEYKNDVSFQPRMGANRLMDIACTLAVLELHAERYLDSAARKNLRQRLQSTEGLWGIIHELNTFAFFIRQGAIVKPDFLKKASVKEITVDWHGTVIPVQCKNLRSGTGRWMSQELFINLASYIVLDMRKAKKSLIIKINATGKSKMPNEDIDFLRSQVKRYAGKTIAPVVVRNKERTYSIMGQQLSNQFTDTLPEESYLRMVISEPEMGSGQYKPVAMVELKSNPVERPLRPLGRASIN